MRRHRDVEDSPDRIPMRLMVDKVYVHVALMTETDLVVYDPLVACSINRISSKDQLHTPAVSHPTICIRTLQRSNLSVVVSIKPWRTELVLHKPDAYVVS